jgi:hypothetical protein
MDFCGTLPKKSVVGFSPNGDNRFNRLYPQAGEECRRSLMGRYLMRSRS